MCITVFGTSPVFIMYALSVSKTFREGEIQESSPKNYVIIRL